MPDDTTNTTDLSNAPCATCAMQDLYADQSTRCPTCASCTDCCVCTLCTTCDVPSAETLCSNCDNCEDCCACAVCDSHRCQARVEHVCSRCECCNDCCECAWCRGCEEPVEHTCYACEACDNCCDCQYCQACQERHRSTTDWCGECESCIDACSCEDTESHRVHSYNTDVKRFIPFMGKPDSGIFLGTELEVQVKNDTSLTDKAEEWHEAIEEFAILKEDGSIGRGFEIVTGPASLTIHREKWTALLSDKTLCEGMISWNAKDSQGDQCCGMHVHVSRAPISALTLGKLLVFVNSPKTESKIIALAGRNSTHWARRIEKKLSDGSYTCNHCQSVIRTAQYQRCKKCQHNTTPEARNAGGRYQAINLQNEDTIEFRLFRGTLLLEHVLANLEFCDAVVRWAMQASIRDCEDWASFWAYVTKQKKTYKHLLAYMADR
jgi:putative amidoligase enzyme